jgi:nucleoside-diphosphate-sugar epimerase
MPKTTLITGAPGWLGTRLAEVLTDPQDPLMQQFGGGEVRNVRVLALPGVDVSPLPTKNLTVVRGNILDPSSLPAALQGVETVFHCAGLIHPKKLKELFLVNAEGTKNLLDAAIAADVKRFVYISSNSPAGVNLTHDSLMKETDPTRPYMAYGRSKLKAEQYVLDAQRSGKIEAVILRPCWFYGPGKGQPERQLRFFRMIQKGNPILFGNGMNMRSMSYLDNTIQLMLLAEKSPKAVGQIYWAADEKPYPSIVIYQTIAKLLGVTLKPRKIPGFSSWICRRIDWLLQAFGLYITEFHVAGEMDRSIACDITKAKTELGYKPTVDLEEGMRRSIAFARKYQGFEF